MCLLQRAYDALPVTVKSTKAEKARENAGLAAICSQHSLRTPSLPIRHCRSSVPLASASGSCQTSPYSLPHSQKKLPYWLCLISRKLLHTFSSGILTQIHVHVRFWQHHWICVVKLVKRPRSAVSSGSHGRRSTPSIPLWLLRSTSAFQAVFPRQLQHIQRFLECALLQNIRIYVRRCIALVYGSFLPHSLSHFPLLSISDAVFFSSKEISGCHPFFPVELLPLIDLGRERKIFPFLCFPVRQCASSCVIHRWTYVWLWNIFLLKCLVSYCFSAQQE